MGKFSKAAESSSRVRVADVFGPTKLSIEFSSPSQPVEYESSMALTRRDTSRPAPTILAYLVLHRTS